MNIIICFILIYIVLIYLVLFYNKLDLLDRYSLFLLLKNIHIIKIDVSLYTKIETIIKFLKVPFKKKGYFEEVSEGSIYSSYLYEHFQMYVEQLNNKYYWNNIFKKEKINHPDLYLLIKNKEPTIFKKIILHKYYIIKPLNGTLGFNIYKIKGSDIDINKYNNVLVQELMFDCKSKYIRNFRFVSLYNGSRFYLSEYKNKNKNKIASQRVHGGKVKLCENQKCNFLSDLEMIELDKMMYQLQELHKRKYGYIFSVGWDIMFNCKENDLKTVCLEGNIFHTTWTYPQLVDNKLISEYKNEFLKFLKLNKKNINVINFDKICPI